MVLILFAILIAALVILAAISRVVPRFVVAAVSVGISALVVVLMVVALAAGIDMITLELPIGPAGAAMRLSLDPLAASFLLVLFLVVPCANSAPLPLAALALTVLADDGLTLAVGLLMLGGVTLLRPATSAVVCLTVALALAGSPADFATIRAAPPEGWHAAVVLLLVLVGAGILSRLSTTIAIYLVLRVLFDLCGVGQPLWWGVTLLLVGAGIATIGSLRAALADTLHKVLSVGSLHQFGMATMALGVALFARAVDLPSVASRALAAAWLAVVCHMLCRTLLLMCADAVESGAGTRRLDLMGGLLHRMPVTSGCCLVGLFTVAVLPPGLGFAAFWLLFQSLIAAARISDFGIQLLVLVVAALTALSVGLMALATVRLFGVVFIGRPRTPRAAVAEEAPRPVRVVLIGVAALLGLFGLLPALVLLPTIGWTHVASGQWLALSTGAEATGYSPIAVAVLLALVAFAVLYVLRRPGERRREPAWSGGFAAPPPWLPFGDPATQSGPASFVEPLRGVLARLPSTAATRNSLVRWRDTVVRVVTALVA
ncbi:MAG: proton-conducting transporter membrane subunit [Acetobacteraceae bacterium]